MAAQPFSPAQIQKLLQYQRSLQSKYQQAQASLQTWAEQKRQSGWDFKVATQQSLAVLSLAGTMAMTKPVDVAVLEQVKAMESQAQQPLVSTITQDEHQTILDKMVSFVQRPAGHLEKESELYLEQQLTDMLGFNVAAELDGQRLNHSIGIMGGEQHLKRFPADTLDQHDSYVEAGIAPNRGAFGWFTEQGQLTEQSKMREKYYFAVQTMYLPAWNQEHRHLKEWYKFRKMIMINPTEKMAVVGVVGDAGPALWVKKQYGGSPEVIREGKVWSKAARGHVMLLFVDDPDDKIPLGPIDLSYEAMLERVKTP